MGLISSATQTQQLNDSMKLLVRMKNQQWIQLKLDRKFREAFWLLSGWVECTSWCRPWRNPFHLSPNYRGREFPMTVRWSEPLRHTKPSHSPWRGTGAEPTQKSAIWWINAITSCNTWTFLEASQSKDWPNLTWLSLWELMRPQHTVAWLWRLAASQ